MDNLNNQNSTNEVQNEQKAPSLMRETIDQNGNVVTASNNQGPDLADKTINAVENFMNTDDHTKEYTEEDVKKNKTNAMICYIPIVPLYFVVTSKFKSSTYLKFHANQGLVVTLGWIISFFVSEMLAALFTKDSMLLDNTPGWVSFTSYILYCICFFATLYGVINTVNGSSKELPLVGKIKLLK